MKTLIIGNGEVGSALYFVLEVRYNEEVQIRDYTVGLKVDSIDIMHICFPYSDEFVDYVKKYQEEYNPKYTVIHSTVPVGTSSKCNACHSPIEGAHPHLEESLQKFTKFVGGKDADVVAEYFRDAGVKVYICRKSETTELAKLLSTTYYALCIEFVKEAERLCDANEVPFSEAFTLFQEKYNEGWRELNRPEYQRPILIPIQKKQGGHCTMPNCELLNSVFAKIVLELSEDGEDKRNISGKKDR